MHVNLLGMHYSPYEGFGRHALHLTRELLRQGVPLSPVSYEAADALRQSGVALPGLTIQLVTQDRLMRLPGRQWAYTMYETTRLPAGTVDRLNHWYERVLVPCAWCADVFRASGVTVPIHVIPEGIDPDELPLPPVVADTPQEPFTFLALADRGRRKGYDAAYQAFYQAFGERADVKLVLKGRGRAFDHLNGAMMGANIELWREDVRDVAALYGRADCFVFPSYGEGWGLPPREAAALAVPTIVSAHSGLLDGIDGYATVQLTRFREVQADMAGGGLWYRADVDEVAEAMTWVYEHYSEAKAKAFRAALWLRDHQRSEHGARALIALLKELEVLP